MNEDDHGGTEPCFAHMLVDGHIVDPATKRDVARFRKSERQRLYAARKATPQTTQRHIAKRVSERLSASLGDTSGKTIAVYWPIRGELDLRKWMEDAHESGATIALPVVVAKHRPIEFHRWTPRAKMKRGFWNIPVPESAEDTAPDTVIVPLLGVDERNFRLGNGGGYYDRTLARLPNTTLTIGVGQTFARMKTIFPMPWDIPMKEVVLASDSVAQERA